MREIGSKVRTKIDFKLDDIGGPVIATGTEGEIIGVEKDGTWDVRFGESEILVRDSELEDIDDNGSD